MWRDNKAAARLCHSCNRDIEPSQKQKQRQRTRYFQCAWKDARRSRERRDRLRGELGQIGSSRQVRGWWRGSGSVVSLKWVSKSDRGSRPHVTTGALAGRSSTLARGAFGSRIHRARRSGTVAVSDLRHRTAATVTHSRSEDGSTRSEGRCGSRRRGGSRGRGDNTRHRTDGVRDRAEGGSRRGSRHGSCGRRHRGRRGSSPTWDLVWKGGGGAGRRGHMDGGRRRRSWPGADRTAVRRSGREGPGSSPKTLREWKARPSRCWRLVAKRLAARASGLEFPRLP